MLNLNCLSNKVNFLSDFIQDFNFDIICVSETWLTGEVSSSTLSVRGFSFYRGDSPSGVATLSTMPGGA